MYRNSFYKALIALFIGAGLCAIPLKTFAGKLKIGDKAPDFTLSDPSGNPVSLSALKGKVVLLDFWASWCGYCKIANSEIIPVYNNYKSEGFEIFSVSLDSKKESWINGIKSQNLSWPYHGSDLGGWESQVAVLYGVDVLPSTFLINEEGIIIGMDLDEDDLEKKLNWLYNEQVHFYPRTATSMIYFTAKTKYEITDSNGKVVLKGKDQQADISTLSPGNYIIRYDEKREALVKTVSSGQPAVTFTHSGDKVFLSRESPYELYSIRGKLLKSGEGSQVDLSGLEKGSYYLSFEGDVHSVLKE